MKRLQHKWIKYGLYSVTAIFVLLIGLAAAIAITFDPNDYKPEFIRLVKEKKNRDLTLDGEIKLTFLPSIGIDLGSVAISESGSSNPFASAKQVRLSLQIAPLFRKLIIIDQIKLEGAQAHLKRNKDGTTNFDDLLKKEAASQVKFDVHQVKISNSALQFDDELANRHVSFNQLELKTGKIQKELSQIELATQISSDQPKVNAKLKLAGKAWLDADNQQYTFKQIKANLDGQMLALAEAHVTLKGDLLVKPKTELTADDVMLELSTKRDNGTAELQLNLPQLSIAQNKITSQPLKLKAKTTAPENELNAELLISPLQGELNHFTAGEASLTLNAKRQTKTIKLTLQSPLEGSVNDLLLLLPKTHAEASITDPNFVADSLQLVLNSSLGVNLQKQFVQADFTGTLDEAPLKGKASVSSFTSPYYQFDLQLSKLDLNRYTQPKPKTAAPDDKPIDFSLIQNLNASGSLFIGEFRHGKLKMNDVRLEIAADNNQLTVDPIKASLYEGNLAGSLRLASSPNKIAVNQKLSAIRIGPLLNDLFEKEKLDGKGNLTLAINAQGGTVNAMKRSADGEGSVQLVDGTLKGFDPQAAINKIKGRFGSSGQQPVAADPNAKTTFSQLSASFLIQNGVAHSDDFMLDSSALSVKGGGDIDIVKKSINYLIKARLTGNSGPPILASLGNLSIPVRITGALDAPTFSVDLSLLAAESRQARVESGAVNRPQAAPLLRERFRRFLP